MTIKKLCTFEGCDRPFKGVGLCDSHIAQRRRGKALTPIKPLLPREATRKERFWAKVDKDGPLPQHAPGFGPCWNWTASTRPDGYGQFGMGERSIVAHRVSYEWACGKIPQGLVIDHQCYNKACVNPEHLRAVSRAANTQNRTGPSGNSTTGIRGVSWRKSTSSYLAYATVYGKRKDIGSFPTAAEAELAAVQWRRENMPHSLLDAERVSQ